MNVCMRRLLILGLAFLVLTIPVAAAPPGRPFVGAWWSIDVDGSYQTLRIGGGGNGSFQVQYRDDGASVCGKDEFGAPLYAAMGSGAGTAEGNTLSFHLGITCLARPTYFWGYANGKVTYDPATGQMTEEPFSWGGGTWQTVWRRMGDK